MTTSSIFRFFLVLASAAAISAQQGTAPNEGAEKGTAPNKGAEKETESTTTAVKNARVEDSADTAAQEKDASAKAAAKKAITISDAANVSSASSEAAGKGGPVHIRGCAKKNWHSLPVVGQFTAKLPPPEVLEEKLNQVQEALEDHIPGWEHTDAILPAAWNPPSLADMQRRKRDALIATPAILVSFSILQTFQWWLLNWLPIRYGFFKQERSLDYTPVPEGIDDSALPQLTKSESALFGMFLIFISALLILLGSYALQHGLVLGSAGLCYELLGTYFVALFTIDLIVGAYSSLKEACRQRGIKSPPVLPLFMSVIPVISPRVDLIKDTVATVLYLQLGLCSNDSFQLKAGVALAAISALTIFLPMTVLFHCRATIKDELCSELFASLLIRGARALDNKKPNPIKQTWREWASDQRDNIVQFLISKLAAQVTRAKLFSALMEDAPQAVLSIAAMFVFHSGSLFIFLSFGISILKLVTYSLIRSVVLPHLRFRFGCTVKSCLEAVENFGCYFKFPYGYTVLHIAAKDGLVEAVPVLLREAPDLLLVKNHYGDTCLHTAACWDHGGAFVEKLTQLLGELFKELAIAKNNEGKTALDMAKERGKTDMVKALERAMDNLA
eukprot:TRINITY_DN1356_c0_g1_i1.p1 TRINITY_DN1356_c0_g1~~TRINITY_DN1356_c0_g1_i1.p1  ORF type:complete len:616 (-),score=81.02 TRINITY_DN1356_c0_g1_i1:155-2002(-)